MPYVVVAQEQTKGRGQHGNIWHSAKGENLLFSFVVFPNAIKAEDQFMLNKVVSLSVRHFIENLLKSEVYIKWPNDIYIDNKKIAGILIEHSIMNDMLSSSIIGIGINVNQVAFPKEIPNPVSLKLVSGIGYNLDECLDVFLNTFQKYYKMFISKEIEFLNEEYLNALYLLEKKGNFLFNKNLITATIKDVDKFGRLMLADENNKIFTCDFNEIKFVL